MFCLLNKAIIPSFRSVNQEGGANHLRLPMIHSAPCWHNGPKRFRALYYGYTNVIDKFENIRAIHRYSVNASKQIPNKYRYKYNYA